MLDDPTCTYKQDFLVTNKIICSTLLSYFWCILYLSSCTTVLVCRIQSYVIIWSTEHPPRRMKAL